MDVRRARFLAGLGLVANRIGTRTAALVWFVLAAVFLALLTVRLPGAAIYVTVLLAGVFTFSSQVLVYAYVGQRYPDASERRRSGSTPTNRVVVLANGRYAVMDRLAERHGTGKAPWPAFEEVSVSGLATALGCPAVRVEDHDALLRVLDEVVPTLTLRAEPLVVEVAVEPDLSFEP